MRFGGGETRKIELLNIEFHYFYILHTLISARKHIVSDIPSSHLISRIISITSPLSGNPRSGFPDERTRDLGSGIRRPESNSVFQRTHFILPISSHQITEPRHSRIICDSGARRSNW